jgi:SAM-dependent MidA family methyltransferase
VTTLPRSDPGTASAGLPEPDGAARDHSARLARLIREEIERGGGSIPFARYMELVLYAPGLGYYSAGTAKLGAEGDFVTAPEISPLFARCVARQCREVLEGLGGGDLLELGAGTGRLAAGLLEDLAFHNCIPERYLILEVSADLRERQQRLIRQRIPGLAERVRWLDRLPEAPFQGVMLANEVLDALPVHRVRIDADEVMEYHIAWENSAFVWRLRPASRPLDEAVAWLRAVVNLPAEYDTEINLMMGPWVRSMAEFLERGTLLFIDYGFPRLEYYHPQRSQGTLMCHYRHRSHGDPRVLPGLQDITAHVDFTALAEAGIEAGLTLAGYTTQADFLLATGLAEFAETAAGKDSHAQMEVARQVKRLVMPSEMGELFKVMALTRGIAQPRLGFDRDRSHCLGLSEAMP